MVGGKTALSRKFFRFAEGTEQPVPPGYVTVIVLVNVELMVDEWCSGRCIKYPTQRSSAAG